MSRLSQVIKIVQTKFPLIRVHVFSGDAGEVTKCIDDGLLIGADNRNKYESLLLPDKDTWGG